MLTSLLRDITTLVSARLPDPLAARPRVRVMVWLVLIFCTLSPFYAGFYVLMGSAAHGVLIMVAPVPILLSLPMLRRTGNLTLSVTYLTLVIHALLVGVAWTSGGLGSTALLWLVYLPIFNAVLLGPRAALMVTALSVLTYLSFYVVDLLAYPWPMWLSDAALSKVRIAETVGLLGSLGVFATATGNSWVADMSARVEAERLLEQERTRSQEAQENLRDTEHIWAVGRVSASLAHEVNSPNAWVMANLEAIQNHLLGESPLEDSSLLAAVTDALEGSRRVARVTEDLRNMARPPSKRVAEHIVIGPVLEVAIRMARTTASGRIHVELQQADGLPLVQANGTALGQAVLNLIINALDALTEANTSEPRVVIRTWNTENQACIEVSDNGPGMVPEVLQQIFEPHFTTKQGTSVVGGTGLGLSLSRRAVRQMGGRIEVESSPSAGSRFRIWLNLSSEKQHLPSQPPSAATPTKRPLDSSWKILAVDDEPMLLRGLHRLLRQPEFELTTTTEVDTAIEAVREGKRFDLILCDLRMPGADPGTLHRRLLEHSEDQAYRIVVMTGGTRDEANAALPYDSGMLSKPFSTDEVRALLASG